MPKLTEEQKQQRAAARVRNRLEQEAKFAREQEARKEAERQFENSYYERLKALVARLKKLGVQFETGFTDTGCLYLEVDSGTLCDSVGEKTSQRDWDLFCEEVTELEEQYAEKQRRLSVAQSAWHKLSDEEKKALREFNYSLV